MSRHVPEVRAWMMTVPWPSAALGRSSMMAPGQAQRAQRFRPRPRALSVPQLYLKVRASRLGSKTPRNRRLETPVTTSGLDLLGCGGQFHPPRPRLRVQQPVLPLTQIRLGTKTHERKIPRPISSLVERITNFPRPVAVRRAQFSKAALIFFSFLSYSYLC